MKLNLLFAAAALLSGNFSSVTSAQEDFSPLVTGLAATANAPAKYNYSTIKGLCNGGQPMRDDTPDSPYKYRFQRTIFEAAGVSAAFSQAVAEAKAKGDREYRYEPLEPRFQKPIKEMWEAGVLSGRIKCDGLGNGDPLKNAATSLDHWIPLEAIYLWGVDPNLIISDEPSLLDYVKRETGDDPGGAWIQLEEIMVEKGALTRADLENKGAIKTRGALYADAFSEKLAKAKQGDASNMYWAGRDLAAGHGTQQNLREAERWLSAAGDIALAKSDTFLLSELGIAYSAGGFEGGSSGLPADYKRAVSYLTPAADKGDTFAALRLAKLYHGGGYGVQRDIGLAEKNFLIALRDERYSSQVRFYLGRMVARGELPGGNKRAVQLFKEPYWINLDGGEQANAWMCSHKLAEAGEAVCKSWGYEWATFKPFPN